MAFFVTALFVVALLEPATAFYNHNGGGGGSHGGLHWGYYQGGVLHPSQWSSQYPTCGMYHQSPIDIHYGIQYTDQLESFNLQAYNQYAYFQLENVGGHTAEMKHTGYNPMYISGGSLGSSYQLKQFHFHWGSDSSQGSEHKLYGRSAPLEMHMVHQSGNRLAVLSFLFVIGRSNQALQEILNRFNAIHYKDRSSQHFAFRLSSLLPPYAGNKGYYRYCGSLTTPPCTEHVIWSVFEDRIEVSEEQMRTFRNIHTGETEQYPLLMNNFRPTQSWNKRPVYHKGPAGSHYSNMGHPNGIHNLQAEFQCTSNMWGQGGGNPGNHGSNHGGSHGGPATASHGGSGHGSGHGSATTASHGGGGD